MKDRVLNMNVAVKEWGDKIVFLRTLSEGAVNRSYGIEVARLAGVPPSVIIRAREILANLEKGELDASGRPALAETKDKSNDFSQLDLFRRLADELYVEVSRSQPDDLTPKAALELIYNWHRHFRLTR
jgi:DNA mismatch repair protein MutS